MINVLVVDDDLLVRKGLISTMPWHLFEMQVVGEAANGEKALEFLDKNDVDLLITDLAMPVMSGIELIRIARDKYSNLSIAILTMHQDFEFIQEALRLGVVDYIVKVQLEKEQFEELLSRMYAHIMEAREKRGKLLEISNCYNNDFTYALLSLNDSAIRHKVKINSDTNWHSIFNGEILVWAAIEKNEMTPYSYEKEEWIRSNLPIDITVKKWKLLKVTNIKGMPKNELYHLLAEYRRQALFYESMSAKWSIIEKSFGELQTKSFEQEDERIEHVRQLIHEYHWINDNKSYESLLSQLKSLRLPATRLIQLIYGFTVDFNRLFKTVMQADISIPNTFDCWDDVEEWLSTLRHQVQQKLGHVEINKDVSQSIMYAIKIIHEEFNLPLFAINVANRVNLSRSYFNECFKRITNYSFNEYLRKVRMDQACDYLSQTMKPIIWIAEHTGYTDEKYFSRVFKEQKNMLPSEYRQMYRQR